MLKRYENFLKELDKQLEEYFKDQKDYICCKKGCSLCCELGDYPFSRLEMEYLMQGFITLPNDIRLIIKKNIEDIKTSGLKEYKCPFLIDNLCVLYERRGLVCRTHGLAYLYNGIIKLPHCAKENLNYSKVFDTKTGEILIDNPINTSLRIDDIFKSKLAEKYELECGEIRRMIDWL